MAAVPCPAALPLCVCGIRGCPLAAEHLALMTPPRHRFWHRRKH